MKRDFWPCVDVYDDDGALQSVIFTDFLTGVLSAIVLHAVATRFAARPVPSEAAAAE